MMNAAIDTPVIDTVIKLLTVVQPPKKKAPATLEPDSVLLDIHIQSLELLDLVMKLEEHFAIEIPDKDLALFLKVSDLSLYIEEKLAAGPVEQAEEGATTTFDLAK